MHDLLICDYTTHLGIKCPASKLLFQRDALLYLRSANKCLHRKSSNGKQPQRLNLLISYSLCTKPPACTRSNFQHTNTFLSSFALLQLKREIGWFCSCCSWIPVSWSEFHWVILTNVYNLLWVLFQTHTKPLPWGSIRKHWQLFVFIIIIIWNIENHLK